jgi:hypothetical protein
MNFGSKKYSKYAVVVAREIKTCPNISNKRDKHVRIKQ